MNKNYLYFSEDVVDIVFDKLKGKFTKEQIFDVFDTSISFIHDTMRYTDVVSIYIRYIGFMSANKKQMVERKNQIEKIIKSRKRRSFDSLNKELECLNKKIAIIDSPEYDIRPITSDINRSIYNMRMGKKWDDVQEFQNKIVF